MFNERDRRCDAVQLMLSTDPNYVNRTIASTLKMQMRTVQRAQGDENIVLGYGLWCGFKWGPHHATSHLRSRLESQHQSVPGCDPVVQSGVQWQTLGVAARLGAGPQVQRDPGLASEVMLRLCTLLSLASLLLRPEPAGLLHLVIRREHHQHALPQHQSQLFAAIRWVFAELPPALVEKHVPVLDPYRGGDWGWRRLHWIDVSCTT